MTARHAAIVGLSALALLACEGDAAKAKAKDRAQEIGEQAKDRAREVGEQAKDKAGELADDAADKGKQLWVERSGQLSAGAKGILDKGAKASGDGVEALMARGEQLAPVAVDVAKTLHSALDAEVDVEPIVQKLDDEQAQAELDQRIQDMPRVETIDGLDVGFKDVTQWDSGGRENQSAYLILWRKDDRLLGLVYRSRKRVNIDKLVDETPRLVAAVQGVL